MANGYESLLQMVHGFWVSQIVRTAADLSLAEHLADGPRTAADIATIEGSDPDATHRLMRACASLGLASHANGAFAGTPLLAFLHKDSPLSLRSYALAQTAPGHWLTWGQTPAAVRAGRTQSHEVLGMSIFDYLAEHPDEAALFGTAMTNLSTPVILGAVGSLDVSTIDTVVDVGGADGAFVLELLARRAHLKGVVLDLPHAVPGATSAAKARGLDDRCTVRPGDFFEQVPEGDLFLLKHILHDWQDEECVRILRNCRAAMRPGGRIAIVEIVMDEDAGGIAPLMDIAMLTMLSARERTLAEFDALLAQAGLRRTRVTQVDDSPYAVIEAVPA
ncbi:methyltransferase [Rugosimonospora acidiphila]|uniref:Methyltransferase n=1 Tax=Rugosimonospora acidiphila TaxID=556531 RepID=A0ABP9SA39_9ACTN